jgi:ubiquinone/menaquinone biosynthesis C-methylase UbiE
VTELASNEPTTGPQAKSPYAAWLRIMAVLYDPFLWLGEVAGMRRRRRTLLAEAYGRVVEIGAGTGLNVAHYPDAVHELVLTEPELGMRRKLARRLDRHARTARILDAPAERLPLSDASVDTVVSTLVLCTVDDPESALREVARCSVPMGGCYSSNASARSRGFWRRARTNSSNHGASSPAGAYATGRPWS